MKLLTALLLLFTTLLSLKVSQQDFDSLKRIFLQQEDIS